MTRAEITDSRPTVRLTDSSSVNDALHGRKVAVIGLGYVGLPTALSLADQGAEIIGCDISESRLAEIKAGRVDLLERDRTRLIRHVRGELFKLTTEPSAMSRAEAVAVCVRLRLRPTRLQT